MTHGLRYCSGTSSIPECCLRIFDESYVLKLEGCYFQAEKLKMPSTAFEAELNDY